MTQATPIPNQTSTSSMAAPSSTPVKIPSIDGEAKILYRLYYHYRSQSPMDLVFEEDASMHFDSVQVKARDFCDKMGWRFIKIRPFISDLNKILTLRKDPNFDELQHS